MREWTDEEKYMIINGRRWRRTNPMLPEEERQAHVNELMSAWRAIKAANKAQDPDALKAARARVQAAKVALGERGKPWWE